MYLYTYIKTDPEVVKNYSFFQVEEFYFERNSLIHTCFSCRFDLTKNRWVFDKNVLERWLPSYVKNVGVGLIRKSASISDM